MPVGFLSVFKRSWLNRLRPAKVIIRLIMTGQESQIPRFFDGVFELSLLFMAQIVVTGGGDFCPLNKSI